MSKMAAEDLTSVSIPISRDYSSPSPSLTTWKRGSRGRGLHSVKKQHRTEYETLEFESFTVCSWMQFPCLHSRREMQDIRRRTGIWGWSNGKPTRP
ncbi:hypothetical protein LINPERHAP2_LOCUS37058 [Linum perenne]